MRGHPILDAHQWGDTKEEIEKEKLLDLTIPEVAKKISEKKTMGIDNRNPQKVVSIKEGKDYLNNGGEYVNTMPGNMKVIVKLPT